MKNARARLCASLLGLASFTGLFAALSASLPGCGPVTETNSDAGVYDAGPLNTETLFPDAPPLPGETECKVVRTTGIEVPPAVHLATCTPIKYPTNPPSGGDHWGIWAAFKSYTKPVPRESYVHDQEHGAVVLLYRCDDGCPDVVKALEEVRDAVTPDGKCLAIPGGPSARIVITPDPLLDTPIAAGAWGATYTATCIDKASLAKFIADTYGHTYEDICASGQDWDNPAAGLPTCNGADAGSSASTGGSGGGGGGGGAGGAGM